MRRRIALRGVVAVAALGVLAGCATTPRPREAGTLSGRLSVSVAASDAGPARQVTAGFELRGDAERGELDLTSPLGTVVARAQWSPGRAELLDGDARQVFESLDALARQAFGEPLPIAALPDWLRGRPWAAAPSSALGPGRFEQLGWTIDASALAEGAIVVRRDAAPAVSLRARVEPAR